MMFLRPVPGGRYVVDVGKLVSVVAVNPRQAVFSAGAESSSLVRVFQIDPNGELLAVYQ